MSKRTFILEGLALILTCVVCMSVGAQTETPTWVKSRTMRAPWVDISHLAQRRELTPGALPEVSDGIVLIPLSSGGEVEILAGAADRSTMARWRPTQEEPWTQPRPQAAALQGMVVDGTQSEDGRLFILLHDRFAGSPTHGDLVLWVGEVHHVQDIGEGSFTVRLADLQHQEPLWGQLDLSDDGSISIEAMTISQGSQVEGLSIQTSLDQIDRLVPRPGYRIPLLDLDKQTQRQVVVDREQGQYLGHPTTVLLEDGRTLLCVYPKGHGRGGVVYKRSEDGGLTWSDRLQVPDNWSSSGEVPTLYRVIDPDNGVKRLIMWSGTYPARLAVSEDDGETWSPLEGVQSSSDGEHPPWGGIVVMACVERLKDGRYMAMFHDDGRYLTEDGVVGDPVQFTLYKTLSRDGGLTWSYPESVWQGSDVHLCEPGLIRSPDGNTIAILLRENSRTRNSYVMFSQDEGETWSAPRELPAALTGDRHQGVYAPDGRLFISFRDTTRNSRTKGDWVGWVGTWDDIVTGAPGQYRVRLKDNKHRWDAAYPGVVIQADGTIVTTTYGHWDAGEEPYILSVRFTLDELDGLADESKSDHGAVTKEGP